MKRNFERFKNIIAETENIIQVSGAKRFEAFKKAVAKVRLSETQEYDKNGELVDDLVGNHNHKDWTY